MGTEIGDVFPDRRPESSQVFHLGARVVPPVSASSVMGQGKPPNQGSSEALADNLYPKLIQKCVTAFSFLILLLHIYEAMREAMQVSLVALLIRQVFQGWPPASSPGREPDFFTGNIGTKVYLHALIPDGIDI